MNSNYNPIRIVIADDHEIFRDGFKFMINKKAAGKINVVGEAENGEQLIKEVVRLRPDIVITDIIML